MEGDKLSCITPSALKIEKAGTRLIRRFITGGRRGGSGTVATKGTSE
jgi:hypothetical protein